MKITAPEISPAPWGYVPSADFAIVTPIYSEEGECIGQANCIGTRKEMNLNAQMMNAAPAMANALHRILYAHDAPNGASMGEAKLCPMFVDQARSALIAAGYKIED